MRRLLEEWYVVIGAAQRQQFVQPTFIHWSVIGDGGARHSETSAIAMADQVVHNWNANCPGIA